ncbi:hypothetical protein BJ741DRAFT_603492 [Chytriomyces cf. hyalinus JEL632]|nr:hypothetical protein BJ741DRAFT_603492 [Chytriomyces cf. hyalinus JEL632]
MACVLIMPGIHAFVCSDRVESSCVGMCMGCLLCLPALGSTLPRSCAFVGKRHCRAIYPYIQMGFFSVDSG